MTPLCLVGGVLVLRTLPPTGPVAKELLQSKVGAVETFASIVRLSLRDPARDARDDLARDDYALYCVGSYSCAPAGLDAAAIPKPLTVHGTATAGCMSGGGSSGPAYREAESRYLEVYNRAKVAVLRERADPPTRIP